MGTVASIDTTSGRAATQDYTCISADSHIDLVWLPPDLFTSNASAAMKERMPRAVDSENGPRWVTGNGSSVTRGPGFAGGVGSSGLKYAPGGNHRADVMAAEGLYSDASRSSCRLADPHQRVKDQDRDGVQCEVLYGILGALGFLNDVEASLEVCRIYNDWLTDFCKTYPKRLLGLPVMPGTDVKATLEEFHRVRGNGFRGIELGTSDTMYPLFDREWEPLWQALEESGVAFHIHAMTVGTDSVREQWSKQELAAATAVRVINTPLKFFGPVLAALIMGGVLERHPKLNIVLGESGIGWLASFMERMDYEWEDGFRDKLDLQSKPSDYWKRQCKATFQYDEVGLHLLDFLGEDTLMWASDFPHPQGTWPDSQAFIEKQFAHLPAVTRHKILAQTAAEFYGLSSRS